MNAITNISNFPLKIIIVTHFIFISLSGIGYWIPKGYLFYNLVYLLSLIWTLHHKQSEDPIQFAFLINIISIILDVFVLAFCYPIAHSAQERFSAALAILHLIFRPLSTIYLIQILRERMNNPELMSNIFPSTSAPASGYDDIDRDVPPNPPTRSYDFTTATQI